MKKQAEIHKALKWNFLAYENRSIINVLRILRGGYSHLEVKCVGKTEIDSKYVFNKCI
jgi:hypothetical protein